MRTSFRKVVPLLAAVALSCGDATGPFPGSESYVLESIDGQPLPVSLGSMPGATINVLSGYLALDDRGNGAMSVQTVREVHQNSPVETISVVYWYLIEGNSIRLLRSCGEDALCVFSAGVISESSVTLTTNAPLGDPSITYVYRRGPLPEDWSRGCWLQAQLGLRGPCRS